MALKGGEKRRGEGEHVLPKMGSADRPFRCRARARAALHDAHRSREDDDGEISAVRVADNEGGMERGRRFRSWVTRFLRRILRTRMIKLGNRDLRFCEFT